MSATGRRTHEERSAESSRALLVAAIELIAERGFERTTTAAICRRAGYSHGMVFVRFGSKEALLESIVRSFEDEMLPPAPPNASGLDQVLHQLDTAAERARAEPEFFRGFCVLCFETVGPVPSLRPWIADWFGRYATRTAERLEAGRQDGSVRSDVDPAHEARLLLDLGIGMSFRWLIAPSAIDLDEEFARLRRVFRERVS